ncbi:MAG: hypothetical protein AB8G05_28385 [Oligoflexales bacterium]
MEHTESLVKIFNKQRIVRIFQKICQSRIQVLIRLETNSTTAIKAYANKLMSKTSDSEEKQITIVLNNISDNGIKHLEGKKFIQLEFALISNKLICSSKIRQISDDELMVELPKSLTSIERRANARFKTKSECCAFVQLSKWKTSAKDLLATPYFEKHRNLATQFLVSDISVGGLCLKTFFPSISSKLSKDLIDEKAKLSLPLKKEISIGLNVRWIKKINEHIKITSSRNYIKTCYLIGCQFTEESDELLSEVKKFIKHIQETGFV